MITLFVFTIMFPVPFWLARVSNYFIYTRISTVCSFAEATNKIHQKSQSHTHTVNKISPQGLGISSHFLSFSFYSAELHFFYMCIRCLYNCMAIIMIENKATKTMFTFQILCFVDIKTNWMHIFQSVTLFSCCGVMVFFRDAKKICMLNAQCAIWWLLRFFIIQL